jgi:3-methyladenine DNA glycosylase AlkC
MLCTPLIFAALKICCRVRRMAEALKTFFSPALVRRLAESLLRVSPAFPEARFVRRASQGLDDLELLDRAKHIARALAEHLPPRYEEALALLMASLGPEHASDELVGAGMTPFFYLPHLIFIAERGLDERDFDRSLDAQRELTKRFTAEFSIRAFLERHPERTLAALARWARDPSPHVRRLVSEGTRPRLPWAPRVRFLLDHPERGLALLELLKDDPATLVRRSVANHLNDLGKAHPELLVEVCRRWLTEPTPERRALVEHALRSAVKRGDAGALSLLGHGKAPRVAVEEVRFEPRVVAIGGRVTVSFTLRSCATREQALLVDLGVRFVKARGQASAKVFKMSRVSLGPRETARLSKSVSLAVHSTRTPYAGKHEVEVIVNGVPHGIGAFTVVDRVAGAKPRSKGAGGRRKPTAR